MDRIELRSAINFKGEFTPPPDKSISHRAVILSSISKGRSYIKNLLRSKDVESTINAFRILGIDIKAESSALVIQGKGLHGLSEPLDVIDCGNSGTTIRLVCGILSGNNFFSVLTGDSSLRTRPMARIIEPLGLMGAEILARSQNRYPPIAVKGTKLKAVKYMMPVASAQVKSSLLLAGLYSDGETEITEPVKSRDHTERMLPFYGAEIKVDGIAVRVKGQAASGRELNGVDITVPGDFSSSAFFIVAALLVPNSEILIKGVGINPTRTGLLEVLKQMGADIKLSNIRDISYNSEPRTLPAGRQAPNSELFSGEPVADIYCKGGTRLKAVQITGNEIPSLIDEFPVLCVAASLAEGTTTIRGAEELRVKESDRIKSITSELRKMGAEIDEYPDGLSIKGTGTLHGADVDSHGDHRIAMSMAVAALTAKSATTINRASAVDISYPGFFEEMKRLTK